MHVIGIYKHSYIYSYIHIHGKLELPIADFYSFGLDLFLE